MTDEKLICRVQDRDEDGLIELHARYVNLVYSMAWQVLNDAGAAEEVTQDVFMKVWQRARQFDPVKGRFKSWLLTIARRTAIDVLRKSARQVSTAWSLDKTEWFGFEEATNRHRAADQRESLLDALGRLPDEQQKVLLLAYFGGMSQSEIAEDLDIPLGTVKTRMRRGIDKLRASLRASVEE